MVMKDQILDTMGDYDYRILYKNSEDNDTEIVN